MDTAPLAGLVIIFVSGVVNASFPLPMKYARAWEWENLWSVFSLLALLVLPLGAATWAVPHLSDLYASLPAADLLPGAVFGLLWGFAQTSFGIAVTMVGMAMAFAIVAGMCAVLGSLIPMMVFHLADLLDVRGLALIASGAVLAGQDWCPMSGRRANGTVRGPAGRRAPRPRTIGKVWPCVCSPAPRPR